MLTVCHFSKGGFSALNFIRCTRLEFSTSSAAADTKPPLCKTAVGGSFSNIHNLCFSMFSVKSLSSVSNVILSPLAVKAIGVP